MSLDVRMPGAFDTPFEAYGVRDGSLREASDFFGHPPSRGLEVSPPIRLPRSPMGEPESTESEAGGPPAANGQQLTLDQLTEMLRPCTTALEHAYNDLSNALYQSATVRTSLNILSGAISSNALWTLTRVSLANSLYMVQENPTFYDKVTSRIAYLEAAVMTLASTITRLVLAILVTIAAAVTFGQLRKVNDELVRQWVQAGLATACFVSSIAGVFSPTAGAICNAFIIIAPITMLTDEVIQTTGRVYRDHRDNLKGASLEALPEGEQRAAFDRQYATPFFEVLDNLFTGRSNITGSTAGAMAGAATGISREHAEEESSWM